MIDGGSYRDCGCDHTQLVDNVGEIGGEPHPRVGIRRWVGSAGLIPFATRLDAAQTRMSLSQRISGWLRTYTAPSVLPGRPPRRPLAREADAFTSLRFAPSKRRSLLKRTDVAAAPFNTFTLSPPCRTLFRNCVNLPGAESREVSQALLEVFNASSKHAIGIQRSGSNSEANGKAWWKSALGV